MSAPDKELLPGSDDILGDLACRVARLARRSLGVEETEARRLGQDLALEISREWGGTSPYIPVSTAVSDRNRRIFADYRDGNYLELARKYNLSERQVRTIVARVRAAEIARSQADLFGS